MTGEIGAGWTCPKCSRWVPYNETHVCNDGSSVRICTPYMPPIRLAWICARCNRINAPHVDRCDCQPTDVPGGDTGAERRNRDGQREGRMIDADFETITKDILQLDDEGNYDRAYIRARYLACQIKKKAKFQEREKRGPE
jgi:hypothetical protein